MNEQIIEKIAALEISYASLSRLADIPKKKLEHSLSSPDDPLSEDELVSLNALLDELSGLAGRIAPRELPSNAGKLQTLLEQFRQGILVESTVTEDKVTSFQEGEFLAGSSTRVVDNKTRKENPRVRFEHLTAADDERPLKRGQRSDLEITGLAWGGVGKTNGCKLHNTPNCNPCRSLAESIATVKPSPVPKKPKKSVQPYSQEVQTVLVTKLGDADVARLREEWRSNESSAEKKRRKAAAATEADKKRRERTKQVQLHVIQDIRKEHGYDARELATFLTQPNFNATKISVKYMLEVASKKVSRYREQIIRGTRKRFPKTLTELETLLPQKFAPMFSDEQIRLYQDHVSRNYSNTEMQNRIRGGLYRPLFIDDDTLLELENAIIRRAWDLRLLAIKTAIGSEDLERDLEASHTAEAQSGTAGDTTVKAGYGSTPGKMWSPIGTNTFERGPVHARGPAAEGSDGDFGGATAEDDYNDDKGLDE